MKSLKVAFFILLICSLILRPPVPDDTYFRGGSVQDAVSVLAEASVNERSKLHSRAMDDDYTHWAESSTGEEGEAAVALAGVTTANKESPLVAGIVCLAAVTGLRELASISLYLLSDYGEANNDLELVDICLRAIPFVDPHFVDAYIIRAYFYALTNPVKSEGILLRGLRWNPEDWELYSDLAWLHLRNTTIRKPQPLIALRYLKAATMVKHPYSIERLYAHLLAHLGQKDKALDVFYKMIDDETIPDVDLKQAERGLNSVKRGDDRIARIFSKLRKVGKQEGTVPVCKSCGHHHHGSGEHGVALSEEKPPEVKKPVHVHGPDCNHEK